jgi:hypothetical protein
MTKRISRKALALAAVGVLASPALAQVANAQIISKTIAVTLKAVGPLPTGVTGANVAVSCQNTTNNPGAIVSSFALTPGQTANLNNFNLTPVASGSTAGSSCSVTVTTTGTANRGVGAITISIGGATDKSGTNSTPGAGYSTGGSVIAAGLTNAGALSLTSNTVPVFDSTDVQITLTYPQITVKKVVVGEEATAGFAYPMSIACSNPSPTTFISPANGLEAGGANGFVTVPVTSTTATSAQRAFLAVAASDPTWTYGWTDASGQVYANVRSKVQPTSIPATTGIILPPTLTGSSASTSATSTFAPGAPNTSTTSTPNGYVNGTGFISTPAVAATPGYAAGTLVVPGGGYVQLTTVDGAGVLTPAAPGVNTVRVWDALAPTATITAAQTAAATAAGILNVKGDVAGLGSLPATLTSVVSKTFTVGGVTYAAGTSQTLAPGIWLQGALNDLAPIVAATSTTATTGVRVYDYRTAPADIPAGSLLGSWANLGQNVTSAGVTKTLFTWTVEAIVAGAAPQPTPNTAGNPSFNGTFTLKAGDSRSFSFNEFPNLTTASLCEVWETNGGGASVTAFSSTVPAINNVVQTPLNGLNNANGRFQSALTRMNETVTVTNSFLGDMIISKVVTGDPKTNVATYEISVACDKGGPKDTFLIKDRQSKVYSGIASGTNCLITETKSDGAVASYKDNSGDNTTDGRVTIKRRPIGGCGDVLGVTGAPTAATPGGPAPTTTFNECWASVIITNDYNPVAAPETTKAAAAAPTAAPATAAPAVAPAPATPVDATPTFAG